MALIRDSVEQNVPNTAGVNVKVSRIRLANNDPPLGQNKDFDFKLSAPRAGVWALHGAPYDGRRCTMWTKRGISNGIVDKDKYWMLMISICTNAGEVRLFFDWSSNPRCHGLRINASSSTIALTYPK